jgi:predicted amidohydrolase
MNDIRIASAQFESKSGDKAENLAMMERLMKAAAKKGAEVICFHELCVTGYGFVAGLSEEKLSLLAEPVPDGATIRELERLARVYDMAVLAGLIERDGNAFYNTHVCVDRDGFIAKARKLHCYLHKNMSCGNGFTLFDLRGWKCSMLICYDCNIPENVREVTLMGADMVFMPHVTGCLDECVPEMPPGSGAVDRSLWQNRRTDPEPLRKEFAGPKGREWLLKWLPARAYDNGIYAVFSNAIGLDNGHVTNGNAMIIDPHGDILVESNKLDDDVVVAVCVHDKIERSAGRWHIRTLNPDLYRKQGPVLTREQK